jgi:hypothetical protein
MRDVVHQIGRVISRPCCSSSVAFRYCPRLPQRAHGTRTMSEGYSTREREPRRLDAVTIIGSNLGRPGVSKMLEPIDHLRERLRELLRHYPRVKT